MWSGDPAVWGWHAPNLFPIVGRLAQDTLVHEGRHYPMKQHGFLRHSLCKVVEAGPDRCAFRLEDSESTRTQYPFAFGLTIAWRLDGTRLDCSFTLENPAGTPLLASLGAHPAFRWPVGDARREDHAVVFERAEPAPIRVLAEGLILPDTKPSPVEDRTLRLGDALFAHDALIFDRPSSRRIVYGAAHQPRIALDFADFPFLGIWSKPGAGFVCLEPWQGLTSPVGFTGEFAEKPGVVAVAPGAWRAWRYGIEIFKEYSRLTSADHP